MANNLDLELARQYFDEAVAIFARDGGRLWGVSLDGPLIFVDYETRQVAANRSDAEGQLAPQGGIWVGEIPQEVLSANTAVSWAGVNWMMLLWQLLPDDPQRRTEFIAHEAFHRIQADLGLVIPQLFKANAHLDTLEGRYWLQLEWRALESALMEEDAACATAIADALLFRAMRRKVFPQAADEERALEMHEGLATYTGFRLSGMTTAQTAERLHQAPVRFTSFMDSFAYASGPAYGYLLDTIQPTWRMGLTPAHDLGEMLQVAHALTLDHNLPEAAAARATLYAGEALWQSEIVRDQERQAQIAAYRARLLEGPVLILPLSEVQCAFDPSTTMPVSESGTVYPFAQVIDAWGMLDVKEGGLWIANDYSAARIAAPEVHAGRPLTGEGWTLHLTEGWEIVPAERPGDLILQQR